MMITDLKIKQFLKILASKNPIPKGTSASALSGAMGAALVGGVASLTLRKEDPKIKEEFKRIYKQASRLESDLLQLSDQSIKGLRGEVKESQRTIETRAEILLETAEKSLAVLKMASYVSEYGNQDFRSEAFCGIELTQAAIYGALESLRAALALIKDTRLAEELQNEMEEILAGTESLVKP